MLRIEKVRNMATFIRLTLTDGEHVWVNMDQHDSLSKEQGENVATKIYGHTSAYWHVNETPEEIMQLIREAQKNE